MNLKSRPTRAVLFKKTFKLMNNPEKQTGASLIDAIQPYYDRYLDRTKWRLIQDEFRTSCHKAMEGVYEIAKKSRQAKTSVLERRSPLCRKLIDVSLSVDLFLSDRYSTPEAHLVEFIDSMVTTTKGNGTTPLEKQSQTAQRKLVNEVGDVMNKVIDNINKKKQFSLSNATVSVSVPYDQTNMTRATKTLLVCSNLRSDVESIVHSNTVTVDINQEG